MLKKGGLSASSFTPYSNNWKNGAFLYTIEMVKINYPYHLTSIGEYTRLAFAKTSSLSKVIFFRPLFTNNSIWSV